MSQLNQPEVIPSFEEVMEILHSDPVAAQLRTKLDDTFPSGKLLWKWLATDKIYLGGSIPAVLIKEGEYDRVESALESMKHGIFT